MKPTLSLIDQTRQFNAALEKNYISLAIALVEVERTGAYRSEGYETFAEFCVNDLGRSKGDVSRLLTVGTFIMKHGFLKETDVQYRRLYAAIKAFPEKDPKYILAAAQTNTLHELETERREQKHPDCTHEERITICGTCKKRIYE